MNRTTVNYCDVEFEVDYEYYPPSKGAREYKTGLQLEPDEPATFEVQDIFIGGQCVWDLLNVDQIDAIEEKLYEQEGE